VKKEKRLWSRLEAKMGLRMGLDAEGLMEVTDESACVCERVYRCKGGNRSMGAEASILEGLRI
jgi:hypothetical protein